MNVSGIAASMHSQRHCRQRAFIAALSPACIHTAALPPVCSGTAAMRHCRQYAAALPPCSVHSQRHCRQHAFTAALPPACIHRGIAASMHSLRHCRRHTLTAALPPTCTYCGIAASNIYMCSTCISTPKPFFPKLLHGSQQGEGCAPAGRHVCSRWHGAGEEVCWALPSRRMQQGRL